MTRAVGRVTHPERDVQWQYDPIRRSWIEHATPNVDELERIGKTVEAIEQENVTLLHAVSKARSRGFSWADIATVLGISAREVRQQFHEVDDQLRAEGYHLPKDAAPPPAPEPEPIPDFFAAFATMPSEEVIAQAEQLPRDGTKLHDLRLKALREAIVVTLYKRDFLQPKIAEIIGVSSQRVSQLIGIYYDRIEREWAAERAQWGSSED